MENYMDVNESQIHLTESEDDGRLAKLKFSWLRKNAVNKNGRTYQDKVFDPAFAAFHRKVESSNTPGMSDHPRSGGTELGGVSHILRKVWMDGPVAWAEADLLKTQKGRDTLRIIKSGVPIGASLRGFGEVDKEGKVKPGLEIKTIDLVVDPSFGPDATITAKNVIESYIPEQDKEDEEARLLQEELKKQGYDFSINEIKALKLYTKLKEDGKDLPEFSQWFKRQQWLFSGEKKVVKEVSAKEILLIEAVQAGLSRGDALKMIRGKDDFERLILEGKVGVKTEDLKKSYGEMFAEAKQAGFTGTFREFILEKENKK